MLKIVGRKPVWELLATGKPVDKICISLDAHGSIIGKIITEAKKRSIRIDRIPKERAKRVFGTGNHQGVMALSSPVEFYDFDLLLTNKLPIEFGLLLALDHIYDPFHFGAVARSAVGAGCDAIIFPARRNATVSEVSIKASAGAILNIPLIRVGNLTDSLSKLKKLDWWIYGAAGEGQKSVWETEFDKKSVLVIGNEEKGISERVRKECDELIRIPMQTSIESLSVSASASVLLFEISRKRH